MKNLALAVVLLSQMQLSRAAAPSVDVLISRLGEPKLDRSVVWGLEGSPAEERIVKALRSSFEQREAKEEKQWLAVALLRMGDRVAGPYEFLAAYAQQAIDDRAPIFQKYDASGRAVRGQFSDEFEAWCLANHLDARAVAARQIGEYPDDVQYLAEATDVRARDLLRRGLESPNPGVVMYCIQGLGRLQDMEALTLIVVRVQRLRSLTVLMQLPWYGRREAYDLLERLQPDPKIRQRLIDDVERARSFEQQAVARRTGKAPLK